MKRALSLLNTIMLVILVMTMLTYVKMYSPSSSLYASTRVLGVQVSPTPTLTPSPTPSPTPPPPTISATSYFIKQLNGPQLIESNSQDPYPQASTTKIMTAIITLENHQPADIITVPNYKTVGSQVGLQINQQHTTESLLYAMLLPSGNDAALVLSAAHPQGFEGFIQQMNQKAQDLGLSQTSFVNPVGLDDEFQYSSARDLAILTEEALKNPYLGKIFSTKTITITDVSQSNVYELTNRNELLFEDLGVTGVKTGTTDAAGQVLVTSIQRQGQTYIIVVMGSTDRYVDTRVLIHWLDQYLGLAPIPTLTPVSTNTPIPTMTPANLTDDNTPTPQ